MALGVGALRRGLGISVHRSPYRRQSAGLLSESNLSSGWPLVAAPPCRAGRWSSAANSFKIAVPQTVQSVDFVLVIRAADGTVCCSLASRVVNTVLELVGVFCDF